MPELPAFKYVTTQGKTYFLHGREQKLRNSKKSMTLYYFAKEVGANALAQIPEGREVFQNPRTQLPMLRRIG